MRSGATESRRWGYDAHSLMTPCLASSGEDFITHEVKADDLGGFHGLVEVAVDSILHHRAQFFEGIVLGVDAVAQSRGVVAAVHFVFPHLEDDFAYGSSLVGCFDWSKPPEEEKGRDKTAAGK